MTKYIAADDISRYYDDNSDEIYNPNNIIERKIQLNTIMGYGTNDSDYLTQYPSLSGTNLMCLYYQAYCDMFKRVYNGKRVWYIGCSVSSEWRLFSEFRQFLINNNYQKGMVVDKDIKIVGNRVYSPDHCLIIPQELNKFFNNSISSCGDHPTGVHFDKLSNFFIARVCFNGRHTIGRYPTSDYASYSYILAKNYIIHHHIKNNTYPMATDYLLQHLLDESTIPNNFQYSSKLIKFFKIVDAHKYYD